ncbi:MAG: CofH family radical SAM protein, partial [Victivallaceae bacterium]
MSRISFFEALNLFKYASLEDLRVLAARTREFLNPGNRVFFIVDANPNYTNICTVHCRFCAFHRNVTHPEAYLLTIDELREKLITYRDAGVRTVLLQGGIHPKVSFDYLKSILEMTVNEFPELHPHYFSAIEISSAATVSGISVKQALSILKDCGQTTIPGGGAEILSEKVRLKISPKKMKLNGWIDFHKQAHKLGFLTTATMMFGHLETAEDVIIHLDTLRQSQDETSGFSAFIPWSYKSPNTPMKKLVSQKSSADFYYRILAISRIYLDNFPHIAASWFGEGKEVGKRGLHYGADDFGGTILNESVHKSAEWDLTA